jgi:hypothetical protein
MTYTSRMKKNVLYFTRDEMVQKWFHAKAQRCKILTIKNVLLFQDRKASRSQMH